MNNDNLDIVHQLLEELNHSSFWHHLCETSRNLVLQTSNVIDIREFQSIIRDDSIPGFAYLLLSGEARLFSNLESKGFGIIKLTPGDVIGLSSIYCKLPIEESSCSKPGLYLEIPESTLFTLFKSDEKLNEWLSAKVLPGELVKIVEYYIKLKPSHQKSLQCLVAAIKDSSIVFKDSSSVDSGHKIFYLSIDGLIHLVSDESTTLNSFSQNRLFDVDEERVSKMMDLEYDKNQIGVGKSNLAIAIPHDRLKATSIHNQHHNSFDPKFISYAVGERDQAIAIFKMLCKYLDLNFKPDDIARKVKIGQSTTDRLSLDYFGRVASSLGLNVLRAAASYATLSRMHTPSLIYWDNVISLVFRTTGSYMMIVNAECGIKKIVFKDNSSQLQNLNVICIESSVSTSGKDFGFSWFKPSIKKYSQSLILVLATSFVIQAFTLVNPLLIQVIIDKVLTQRSTDTLQILGFALLFVTIIEGIMTVFRGFLFNDITNKIDISIGSQVVAHLFKLPLSYFDKRPVGELGTRLAELEKIRNFITGQALTSILDASFSVIYISIMVIYSPLLTLVALCILPVQIALTVFGAPLFRKQYRRSAEENARTQSHLIEAISGIHTVKAQSIEVTSRWKWQEFYNKYIQRSFEKNMTGQIINQFTMVMQKISQLMVLWVGADLVLKGEFTIGQLIAFRIISGYVTQPLLRLSTVWQSYQELKVSFERLSDIVDTKPESDDGDDSNIVMPKLKGAIQISNLYFAFDINKPSVLNGIDMCIDSGEFVAIVGLSGSGKSTLTKLIARLYKPTRGTIKIDGLDNTKVELSSLRSQIGIVPQDPLLFKGTIYDNIALSTDNSTSEMVVDAAKAACAHDFIMDLPDGYNSQVGEKGSSLSGGQRQRVALARTLICKPKLLLLDEATSALDYDTEKRVCESLISSAEGCTVIFVTHRLPTIKNSDKIFLMNNGQIQETGKHHELMLRQGYYFALYKQQEAN